MMYAELSNAERAALWQTLEGMADYLRASFSTLTADAASQRGADDGFAPVEQVWHLADLEREGFGERIRRLRSEPHPQLPDFDGTRIAAERNYRTLSLADGLAAFAAARAENLALLRSLGADEWRKAGEQEGVGSVSLCDIPVFIARHDAAHRREIEDWKRTPGH